MGARVMTLWYFLLRFVEICCLIKTCARMVLFDRSEGGGAIPGLAGMVWIHILNE